MGYTIDARTNPTTWDFSTFSAAGIEPRIALVRQAAAGRDIEFNAFVRKATITTDPQAAALEWTKTEAPFRPARDRR